MKRIFPLLAVTMFLPFQLLAQASPDKDGHAGFLIAAGVKARNENDRPKAFRCFERAYALYPEDPLVLVEYAREFEDTGARRDALRLYMFAKHVLSERKARRRLGEAETQLLATAIARAEQLDEATREAAALNKRLAATVIGQAEEFFRRGFEEQALGQIRTATMLDPDNPHAEKLRDLIERKRLLTPENLRKVFNAPVRIAEDGSVRLIYTFDNEKELRDFVPGKNGWTIVGALMKYEIQDGAELTHVARFTQIREVEFNAVAGGKSPGAFSVAFGELKFLFADRRRAGATVLFRPDVTLESREKISPQKVNLFRIERNIGETRLIVNETLFFRTDSIAAHRLSFEIGEQATISIDNLTIDGFLDLDWLKKRLENPRPSTADVRER